MKPLLIVKLQANISPEAQRAYMEVIKTGIEQGALVIGPESELIAFDELGRLVYPIPTARDALGVEI